MRKALKKALYKCDKKDFIQKFNRGYDDPRKHHEFPDMMAYLGRYGMEGGKREGDLIEMIYIAKRTILAQSAKAHYEAEIDYFSYDWVGNLNIVDEQKIHDFIRDPIHAMSSGLRNAAREYDSKRETDPDKIEYNRRLVANCESLAQYFDANYEECKEQLARYERKQDALDVLSRVTAALPANVKSLDAAFQKTKGGFFLRHFGRSSPEYNEFKAAFREYSDVQAINEGSQERVENASIAYLRHVIPDFEYSDELSKEEVLSRLHGTQKVRASFCFDVLKSINEHKNLQPYMTKVNKVINGIPLNESEMGQDVILENSFRKELIKDLDELPGSDVMAEPEVKEKRVPKNEEEKEQMEEEEANEEMFNQLVN